jgi:uncharacterized protein YbjT (DUF2867 family)
MSNVDTSDGKTLVTGATGNVAGHLIPQLKTLGLQVRALVHSEEKARGLEDRDVETVVGDFEKPDTLSRALDGVSSVFLVTPPHEKASDWAHNFITAAQNYDSPYIVRLSALKASQDGPTENTRLHGRTDKELQDSGLPFTILRPHFYMQNLFVSAQSLASDGVMYWGMGDGKLGMIDTRDVAEIAAKILTERNHNGRVYDLTGPGSVSFHDIARSLSTVLGREIKYIPVSVEAVEDAIRQMGMGDWFAKIMGQYSKAYSEGWGDFTTSDVKDLTGHEALSIDRFLGDIMAPALSS